MVSWTKEEAFAEFGTKCTNVRWSRSARSADRKTVVLTFWTHCLDDSARPIVYDDTGWSDPDDIRSLGNREKIENIRFALDNLDGIVRVVVVVAKSTRTRRRSAIEHYPEKNLRMRITYFNEENGEFRAEEVE